MDNKEDKGKTFRFFVIVFMIVIMYQLMMIGIYLIDIRAKL